MYTEQQQWALDQVLQLKSEKKLSQNEVGKLIGVSGSVLSQLYSGSYGAKTDKMFDTIISYFENKAEASTLPAHVFDRTYKPISTSEAVYSVIRNCHLKGGCSLAFGDSGVGKSMAAKKYSDDHPSDTIRVTAHGGNKSLKNILQEIGDKVGVREKNINKLWRGIEAKLRDGMCIIIDEAQHLSVMTIDALRAMPDNFEDEGKTLGLVFVGNTKAINKFGGEEDGKYSQIASRTHPKRQFLLKQIKRDDIQILFPIANDDKVIDFLYGLAQMGEYNLRGTTKTFMTAIDNGNTSYDGLVAAAKEM